MFRDKWLKIGQVASLLSRHPNTVRRYERVGILPPAMREPLTNDRVWRERDIEFAMQQLGSEQRGDQS